MLELLLPCVITLLVYYIIKYYWTSSKCPPGPYGIPYMGVLPHLAVQGILQGKEVSFRGFVNKIGQQYRSAGVISFCMGTQRFVHLHTYDAVKEALVDKASDFSWRPGFQFYLILGKPPSGIVLSDGPLWKVHRRFATMVLRNLGFGKTVLEEKIITESKLLNEKIRNSLHGRVNTLDLFVRSVGNIIAQLLLGSNWTVEEFDELYENIKVSTQSGSLGQLLQIFYPNLAATGILALLLPNSKTLVNSDQAIEKIMSRKYEEISQRYDGTDEPSCYVEAFIKESIDGGEVAEAKGFHREQAYRCMFDLIIAGTDTTTNALAWSMIYLAKNPHVMKKLQAEIDSSIQMKFTKGEAKTLEEVQLMYSDRISMPYLNAVMDEVQRCSSIVFHSVQHAVKDPITFRGFQISPKDLIFYNIHHIHHDTELWGDDVNVFRPERFLDGEIYKPSKYLIPFGLGKRSCLGENLARTEFFQFLTALCREFDITPCSDNKFTLDELIAGGTEGVIRAPSEHQFIFTTRS